MEARFDKLEDRLQALYGEVSDNRVFCANVNCTNRIKLRFGRLEEMHNDENVWWLCERCWYLNDREYPPRKVDGKLKSVAIHLGWP